MERIKPRTLSGFMELLPRQQVYFDAIKQTLRNSFALFGFTPLDTPLMETAEILLSKGGGETDKQIYSLSKGGTDLALRYELTTSLAKYAALYYNDLTFPFRRYEIGKVYRGERAQRGRFREFYQADIDIIGDGKLDVINEAEIPAVIYKCFVSMGLERFVIRINNRKVISGFLEIAGAGGKAADVLRIVDKLEKAGADKVSEMLTGDAGLSDTQTKQILDFIAGGADPFYVIDSYRGKNVMFDRGADELTEIRRYLSGFGVPESNFRIDLSIARGLDYYTGTVFETTMTDYPGVGSVCSGGRYDNLAGSFIDRELPGVGISIGLTRLFYVLSEEGLLNGAYLTAPADVLIIPMTDDLSHAVSLATLMRESGLRTQIFGDQKKLKTKISFADKLGIPFVVFLGSDEVESGQITVKEMKTGTQTTASPAIITAALADKIKEIRACTPL